MPSFPTALAYLWRAYNRLRRRVGAGFSGPMPISWRDIEAFVRQTRFPLAPWEVEILERIDDAYLQPAYRRLAAQQQKQQGPAMIAASDGRAVRQMMRSFRTPKKEGVAT